MFDSISHKELINLFTLYTNSDAEPFFIINEHYKVVFANKALENYVQKPIADIINSDFGKMLGCMYMEKDNNSCGDTYYCSICNIRNAIIESFTDPKAIIRKEVVRDIKIDDQVLFKQMSITAYYVDINNKPHVAVSIFSAIPD